MKDDFRLDFPGDNATLPPEGMPSVRDVTDWMINVENIDESVCFCGQPWDVGSSSPHHTYAQTLATKAQTEYSRCRERTFSITDNGLRFRCEKIGRGRLRRIHLRVMKREVWDVEQLQLPNEVIRKLVNPGLVSNGGLILIVGATGQGKTTTASALVKAWLTEFGGFALTLEDPPEDPLEGWYGKNKHGYCLQVDVTGGDFKEFAKSGVRIFPVKGRGVVFIGEVRCQSSASEAIDASGKGYLVVTTIHANKVSNGIERLINLAKEQIGVDETYRMVAENLRFALSQKIDHSHYSNQFAFLEADTAVKTQIRTKKINFEATPVKANGSGVHFAHRNDIERTPLRLVLGDADDDKFTL